MSLSKSFDVLDSFLRYVKIDTGSSEQSNTFPSTDKQRVLANLLRDELEQIGVSDVCYDEKYCYVYGKIPGNVKNESTIGFIAHMDTSPETSGENVKPRLISDYDGNDIVLNGELNVILSPKMFPELKEYIGKSLVVTDGTTLLGADDKAGIAEIMTMAKYFLAHPELPHRPIAIAFTPDEEIGCGVDHFDLDRFGADYAYTVDGGGLGELEYENFNAASANVVFHGVVVHPGEAKDKMVNASLLAMEFENMLPRKQKPEYTSGYEGFFHLTNMCGSVDEACLSYIIRDHDKLLFEEKKQLLMKIADKMRLMHGEASVELEIKDSYYNMREKIEDGAMFLVDNAKACMLKLGITPKIQPIRGGTDGARLSFMGLPCPNICTGGHNYHGKYEYVCVESMEKIVELLIELCKRA